MDGDRRIQQSTDCTAVELDGRVSIYNPETQTVHTLSTSATAVWHELETAGPLEEVTLGVARMYAASVEDVRADVAAVVRTLTEAGLLSAVGRSAPRSSDGDPSTSEYGPRRLT